MNANGELTPDNEGLTSSNGLYTTDVGGQIVLSKLLPGTYVVSEVKAPDNYQADPTPQTVVVNAGDTQTLRFYDDPLCTLTILKRDAVTQIIRADSAAVAVHDLESHAGQRLVLRPLDEFADDQGGGRLIIEDQAVGHAGAHHDILGSFVLDVAGGGFALGHHIGPVGGQARDSDGTICPGGVPSDVPAIKAGEAQQLTFWNKRAGTLVIQKKDSVTGAFIAGAQFQLTYANGGYVDNDNGHLSSNGLYTTDDKGEIRISGITGTVVAKEVSRN